MYTATITGKKQDGAWMLVNVSFTNGTNTFTESYTITALTDLKSLVNGRLNQLNGIAAVDSSITIGVFDPSPVAQTQADIDRDSWLALYRKWIKVKFAIDQQVLTGNETQVVTFKTNVQSGFKAAYLDYL
jgi:hypothetical protein